MKLVTISGMPGGASGAILANGEILNLSAAALQGTAEVWIPASVRGILHAGKAGLDIVRSMIARVEKLDDGERKALRARNALLPSTVALLAPIPDPKLLLAAGLAFKSHLAEMSGTPVPAKPTAFIKSVNSITGPNVDVTVPSQAPDFVDYEGELAIVFGSHCYQASVEEAQACIAGYTCANDISARDWVFDVFKATEAWAGRSTWEVNIMGKQLPGFTPLGPALVTVDEFADITKAKLETRLNGKVMQTVTFDDLIFSMAQSASYFSRWYAFEPGDILLTGTPAGVGVGRKPAVFMHAGDIIEIEVEGIGILRNTMVAASGAR